MKIILCGYHWTGCKALDILSKGGHEVFVYTHQSPHYVPSLAQLCDELGVPCSLENISTSQLPFRPDLVCSVYYRHIIKRGVIAACGGRIFNLHPSLLPLYRGCSSLTWAMINGERETGFTYHYIDEQCDTGPVILQRKVAIERWDTQLSLYNKVMFESMKYFHEVVELVANGHEGMKQEGESSYYPRGCPFGGVINPEWDAAFIKRFIRAMHHPPLPPATFSGREIHSFDDYLKARAELADEKSM